MMTVLCNFGGHSMSGERFCSYKGGGEGGGGSEAPPGRRKRKKPGLNRVKTC